MQPKKSAAVALALSATAVLAVLRIIVTPRIANGEGGVLNIVLFCLVPLAAAALLFLGGRCPAAVPGQGFSLVSLGAVFTGVAMAFSSISAFFRWRGAGVWPYPSDQTPTPLSAAFLCALALFGLLGGLFLVLQGASWYRGKPLPALHNLLSLAPLVWVWVRVCQFEVSYYSSLPVMHHWYDLALLIVEMLFFLSFARGALSAERPPRLLLGLSLITGMLAAVSCVTRVAMALLGEQEAWQNTGLVTAADLGVCLFAFGFALAYTPAEVPVVEEAAEEPVVEEPVVEEPVIEEPVVEEPVIEEPLLEKPLIEEPIVEEPVIEKPIIEEPIVEEPIVEEPPKPLELEDFIWHLLQNPDDEQ